MQYSADQIVSETGGVSSLKVKTDLVGLHGRLRRDPLHSICILYIPEDSDNDHLSKYHYHHQTSWKIGYY